MPFNHFQFRRNVTGARNWHDRTVNDPRQVSVQCCSDRNGIVAGPIRLCTDAQIDDDVFDHRACPMVGGVNGIGLGLTPSWFEVERNGNLRTLLAPARSDPPSIRLRALP
jgi:hypothetical protein